MDIHDYADLKGRPLNRIMDFTSDANPLGPSEKAKNAVRKSIRQLRYPPDRGSRRLKRLICKREGIGEEEIVIGPEPAYTIEILLKMSRPKTALVPSPVSETYKGILKEQGAEIRPFHLINGDRGFAFETGEFVRIMEDVDLVLMPSPHNITGACLSPDSLISVISQASAVKRVLIIDETNRGLPDMPSLAREIVRSGTSVALRSFSAFYGLAGFQFGYTIGPIQLIRGIKDYLGRFPVNLPAESAALASLLDRGYRKRTLAYIEEEKCFMRNSLARAGGIQQIDTPCGFFLIRLSERIAGLRDAFLKRGIIIEDFTDKDGFQYIRVPVRKHAWNAGFIKALKNILGVKKPCSD